MSPIGIELKKCRKQLRLTLPEMAAQLGVSTTTIVNYETGRRIPEIDFLIEFAAISDRDFSYWLGLRISSNPSAAASAALDCISQAAEPSTNQPFVSLPLIEIGDVAIDGGTSTGNRITDEIPQFSRSWLERELNARPDDLCLVSVDDDSMTPTLRPGDTILLDRRANTPGREGIYIIRMNGVSLIKRLQLLPGGQAKISSDNPAYETFTVALDEFTEKGVSILGRVVWVIWAGRKI